MGNGEDFQDKSGVMPKSSAGINLVNVGISSPGQPDAGSFLWLIVVDTENRYPNYLNGEVSFNLTFKDSNGLPITTHKESMVPRCILKQTSMDEIVFVEYWYFVKRFEKFPYKYVLSLTDDTTEEIWETQITFNLYDSFGNELQSYIIEEGVRFYRTDNTQKIGFASGGIVLDWGVVAAFEILDVLGEDEKRHFIHPFGVHWGFIK